MYHPDENNYFDDKLSVYIEKVKVPTPVSYTHLTLPTTPRV